MTRDDHNDLSELLSAYLDGELDERARAEVAAYVASEPAAEQLLEELRSTRDLLNSMPPSAAPAGFAEDVVAAAERRALLGDAASLAGAAAPARRWTSVAAAAAIVLLIGFSGSFMLIERSSGPALTQSPADASSEPLAMADGAVGGDSGMSRNTLGLKKLSPQKVGERADKPVPPPPAPKRQKRRTALESVSDLVIAPAGRGRKAGDPSGDQPQERMVALAEREADSKKDQPSVVDEVQARDDDHSSGRRAVASIVEETDEAFEIAAADTSPTTPPAAFSTLDALPKGPAFGLPAVPEVVDLELSFSDVDQLQEFLDSAGAVVGRNWLPMVESGQRPHSGTTAYNRHDRGRGDRRFLLATTSESLGQLLTRYALSVGQSSEAGVNSIQDVLDPGAVKLSFANQEAQGLFHAQTVAYNLGNERWRRQVLNQAQKTAITEAAEAKGAAPADPDPTKNEDPPDWMVFFNDLAGSAVAPTDAARVDGRSPDPTGFLRTEARIVDGQLVLETAPQDSANSGVSSGDDDARRMSVGATLAESGHGTTAPRAGTSGRSTKQEEALPRPTPGPAVTANRSSHEHAIAKEMNTSRDALSSAPVARANAAGSDVDLPNIKPPTPDVQNEMRAEGSANVNRELHAPSAPLITVVLTLKAPAEVADTAKTPAVKPTPPIESAKPAAPPIRRARSKNPRSNRS